MVQPKQPHHKKVVIVHPESRYHKKTVVVHPKRGHVYRTVHVKGRKYFYRNGVFYRSHNSGYVSVQAPLSAVVVSIPAGFRIFWMGGKRYYYYDGIYYKRVFLGYQVVRPPAGIYLTWLPGELLEVYVGTDLFFIYHGVYYRRQGAGYITAAAPAYVLNAVEKEEPEEIETKYYVFYVQNSNGSQTPVEMEKIGEYQWKGPRGEIYTGMPTQEQLAMVYGI